MRFCVTSSEKATPAMSGATNGTETGFGMTDVRRQSL